VHGFPSAQAAGVQEGRTGSALIVGGRSAERRGSRIWCSRSTE